MKRISGVIIRVRVTVCIAWLLSLASCTNTDELARARALVEASDTYYAKAVAQYTRLAAAGKNKNALTFQLGKLYYDHGAFGQACEELKKVKANDAAIKYLAMASFRLGNFTDALEVFSRNELADPEYRYYHGLTCEKLNLYDRALKLYQGLLASGFAAQAQARIDLIEKQVSLATIETIAPATYEIIKNAPPQERFPQAGAIILRCDEKTVVTPGNTEISTLHYIIKILNERGKEDYSETHLEYDSTFEKVELKYARTIKPDGTVLEVGSRHIRDVSKYMNFPLYSNARVFIISFPEITEGAVIEYEATIVRNELINKKDFVMSYPLQAGDPIVSADFTLSLPEAKAIQFKNINSSYNTFGAVLVPEVRKEKDRTVYAWRFKDIPQIMPESSMPPMVQINPGVLGSTFGSWDQVYQWWWNLAKDKIVVDKAIKEQVAALIAQCASPEEKAKAIYDFCARKIRYVAVEYGQAGYEPHKAGDIFRNKYGDCKDQAILLVTMLKEAGITAWPVLIPTRDCHNLQQDFPSVLFDHCIAALSRGGGMVFMDPTAETCPFGDLPGGDQDRRVLVIKDTGYSIETTPLFAASHNKLRQSLHIVINSDESIDAQKAVESNGIYNQGQRHWFLYTPPELIEQALSEKIQDVSIGAKLKGYTIKGLEALTGSVSLDYAFSGPEYLTSAGLLRLMPQLAGVDASLVAKEARTYALDFGILDMKETDVAIEVPAQWKLKYLPQAIEEDNTWMQCSLVYYQEGRTIHFKQKVELKKKEITREEYPAFKKFFEGLAKKIKQRVVLEKAQ